jgi:ABC-type Fe3+-siderophore transport system permease subunit
MTPEQEKNIEANHADCIERSYFMGITSGAAVFAALYFAQKRITRDFKGFSPVTNIASSGTFAVISIYLIVNAKQFECTRTRKQKLDGIRRSAHMKQ